MEIVILPTAVDAERLTARLVADRVKAKPDLVLGCATGRTMEGIYTELVRLARAEKIDFSGVRTFNLDEYIGVAPDDERSYYSYMHRFLFSRVNLDPANAHVPNGMAADPEAEAVAFEATIRAVGGIDLQLLGLGNNGHIGFNEPLSGFESRTRVQPLAPHTRQQNAGLFGGDPDAVPATALTMGVGTILDARETLLVATGARKAQILARTVEGPIAGMVTATALQLHANCHVVADDAAAAQLTLADYFRDVARQHPTWGPYLRAFEQA